MAVDGYLNFNTKVDSKGFNAGLSSISKGFSQGVKGVSKGISSINNRLNALKNTIVATFSFAAITQGLKDITESSATVKAMGSQYEQTFGSISSNAKKAMQTVAKESGIVESRLQGVGTSIYAFAKTTGMDNVTALNLMQEALQVTADSAAYYDRSLEDTAESLKSFLKGNYENDSALGLSCTETTRNAMANKLYGKSFQELSESQKQLALLQMVKEANQLSGAMGQASREADGWENVTGNLKESWKQLLAVVGQPVLQFATQAIKRLTDMLQSLTAHAQQAVSAMYSVFGWEQQSQNSNPLSAVADSANNATESIEEAEKANEDLKKSLSGFDKLNVMSQDKEDDSSNGDSTSDTSTALTPFTAESLSTTPLDNFFEKAKSTLTELKSLINSGDFSGLGEKLAGDFNSLLEKIDWGRIQQTVTQWTSNLTNLLNGTISGTDWNLVGFSIGEFINTGISSAFTFVTQFDWEEYGKSIKDTVTNACNTIQWDTLGQTMSTGLSGALSVLPDVGASLGSIVDGIIDTAFTFFTTFNWQKAGKDLIGTINNFLIAIDWGQLAFTLSTAILGLWDSLKSILANFDWYNLAKSVIDFILGVDWWGIISGPLWEMFNFMFNPFSVLDKGSIANTIATALWDLWCGILDGLGITEYWTNVFFEAWNGVKNAWSGTKQFFANVWNGIKGAFSNVTDWFKTTFKKAWSAVINVFSTGGKIFKGIKEGISSVFKTVVNNLIDGINNVIAIPFNKINEMLNTIRNVEVVGAKLFENLWQQNPLPVPRIPKLATGTVVPANYGEFTAILGDNKREPEVVSPLSTMKQAMREVLEEMGVIGGSGNIEYRFVAELNGKPIFEEVVTQDKIDRKRHGGRSRLGTVR